MVFKELPDCLNTSKFNRNEIYMGPTIKFFTKKHTITKIDEAEYIAC